MAQILALSPSPWLQFVDANGAPYAGAQLFTYESGTNTKLATYSDSAGTISNLNPVFLDSAGRATLYLLPQAYKFVLAPAGDSDPPNSPIRTTDPVGRASISSANIDISAVAGEDLSAGNVAYMSSGSGGLTAGRWYKTDSDNAYSSTAAVAIGIVPALIPSGTSGSIRILGTLSGVLGGLTPGSYYYIDSVAGGVTASAPTGNARIVGVSDTAGSIVLAPRREDSIKRIAGFQTSVGNVGAGEDTLATFVFGVGRFWAVGVAVRGRFWGFCTNNANAKQIRLRVIENANNTLIVDFANTINEPSNWVLDFIIQNNNDITFNSSSTTSTGPVNGPTSRIGNKVLYSSTTLFANAITLTLTGEATTTNDIQMLGGLIEIVPTGY